MSTITFTTTLAGLDAAFAADDLGLDLPLTHIQFGHGRRTPTGSETALVSPDQYVAFSAGYPVSETQRRMVAYFPPASSDYEINEIGIWSGVPGAVGSKLCFYWSQSSGVLAKKFNGVAITFSYNLDISGISGGTSITIVVDEDQVAETSAMIGIHDTDADAHPAIRALITSSASGLAAETAARIAADDAEIAARTAADNAEIAARTAADNAEASARASGDSANSTAITAEATTRSNADTALQNQITALANKTLRKARWTSPGSMSWTPPADVSQYVLTAGAGGGGGEGGTSGSNNGAGGGAGEFIDRMPFTCTPSVAVTGFVGAGGSGGAGGGSAGTDGGDTTFGSITLNGGHGASGGTPGIGGYNVANAVYSAWRGQSGGRYGGENGGAGGGGLFPSFGHGGTTNGGVATDGLYGAGGGGGSGSSAGGTDRSGGDGGDGFIEVEYWSGL